MDLVISSKWNWNLEIWSKSILLLVHVVSWGRKQSNLCYCYQFFVINIIQRTSNINTCMVFWMNCYLEKKILKKKHLSQLFTAAIMLQIETRPRLRFLYRSFFFIFLCYVMNNFVIKLSQQHLIIIYIDSIMSPIE